MATRTLRGALAGAAAAAVWAAQQPLDRRFFGVAYDDTELLGRWVVPAGGPWQPVGLALHLANGAVFGAIYANVAPSPARARRAARAARRPRRAPRDLAGDAPCSTACTRRASDLPQLWGSGRAFAQATWRHLLFGFVLGELERRLNPPEDALEPVDDAVGLLERARLGRAPGVAGTRVALSRRVVITGGSGFAGGHLADACVAAGDDVVSLTRSGGGPGGVAVDLLDAAATRARSPPRRRTSSSTSPRSRTSGARGATPPRRSRDNLATTLNVLEAVRTEAPDATVVAVSSGEVYGPPESLPVDESAPLRPQNPYAVSKAASDLLAGFYADGHGLQVVAPAPFNHSGPGQPPIYAIASFSRQVAAGLEAGDDPIRVVTGNPDARRDYTDVRDVVRAYRLLADAARARRASTSARAARPPPPSSSPRSAG